MIYKFKSKSSGDVIMLGGTGDRVLRAIGREPATKGILEWRDLPAAMHAIESAIDAEQREREQAEREAEAEGRTLPARDIGLRQRAWPLVEMMKRAHAAEHDIVWGV